VTSRRKNVPEWESDGRQLQAPPLAPISRSELARLRRGELDANAVAALVERTVGLAAPAAPAEGDLLPTQSGWLLGAGRPPSIKSGKVSKWAQWVMLASYGPYFVATELLPPHSHLIFLFLLAPLLLQLPFAIASATFPRARLKRQLELAGRVGSLADVPDGTLVRVSGTVLPQATVPTLFRGVPAVLFRNRMGPADETRGLDFFLGLDNGEQAKVAVRGSFLLDRPPRTREPPVCGPVSLEAVGDAYALRSDMLAFRPSLIARLFPRYESSVGPGDRIEVCGVVRHVLVPELQSLRGVPTQPLLEAREDAPLLVRRDAHLRMPRETLTDDQVIRRP
jgi:hypothetical protein